MKRIIYMLLAVCLLFTMSACQPEGSAGESEEPQQALAAEPSLSGEPPPQEPMEPQEPEQTEETPFPGLPVYVETQAYRDYMQAAEKMGIEDPDAPPAPAFPYRTAVFDHYGDPPPEGIIRLVYLFNYGEREVYMVEDEIEISKILEIVDAFAPSDFNQFSLSGGEIIQIQVVRDGTHQCYFVVTNGKQGDSYLASNARESDKWYETSEENCRLLLNYFGRAPR